MEVIISIISLLVIVTVTVVLLYQNASVRDNTTAKMQSMVDKLNDANYYTFQYDKKQEHNIKTLDDNITTVAADIRNVNSDLQAFKPTVVPRRELAESVTTKQFSTNDFTLNGKYKFQDDSEGNWLRLNGPDGKFKDGWAMDKLYVEKNMEVMGKSTLQDIYGDRIEVNGGESLLNPNKYKTQFPGSDGINHIRGDVEIDGNVKNMGSLDVGHGINARNSVKVNKTDFGMFVENKAANNVLMGIGSYGNNEMRLANTSTTGSITMGMGPEGAYDPLLHVQKTNVNRELRLGGNSGLRVTQTSTDTATSKKDDITLRTNANTNMLNLQSGAKPGLRIHDGVVVVGDPQEMSGTKLDIYGNVVVRGDELRFGNNLALVKKGNELLFNQGFPDGTTFYSDVSVIDGKCVQVGKNDANKEINSGKICYKKFSNDSVDIVGAGEVGTQRSVHIWDRLETDAINVKNKLCIDNTCMDKIELKTMKHASATGNICIGNTCLTEAELIKLKQTLATK